MTSSLISTKIGLRDCFSNENDRFYCIFSGRRWCCLSRNMVNIAMTVAGMMAIGVDKVSHEPCYLGTYSILLESGAVVCSVVNTLLSGYLLKNILESLASLEESPLLDSKRVKSFTEEDKRTEIQGLVCGTLFTVCNVFFFTIAFTTCH